jgi:predicted nucleotidyltransferase
VSTDRLARDDVVDRLERYFAEKPGDLAAAYLYGSVARDEARPGSDVDVGVLFVEAPLPTLAGLPTRLEAELAEILGAKVQAISLNSAPVDLVKRVLRDGVLLLDRDRSRRIAFEVRSRNAYWDLLPILERYRHPRAPA